MGREARAARVPYATAVRSSRPDSPGLPPLQRTELRFLFSGLEKFNSKSPDFGIVLLLRFWLWIEGILEFVGLCGCLHFVDGELLILLCVHPIAFFLRHILVCVLEEYYCGSVVCTWKLFCSALP